MCHFLSKLKLTINDYEKMRSYTQFSVIGYKRSKPQKYLQFEFLNTILKKSEFLEPSWETQNACTATKQGIVFKQSADSILVFSLNWHDWSVTALPHPRCLPLVERGTYIIVGMSPGVSFPWNSLLLFSSGFSPLALAWDWGNDLKIDVLKLFWF